MKETVLITGANSFIAKHLIPILSEKYELKLLTRQPKKPNEYAWDIPKKLIDKKALNNVQYIIHLAGAKLHDGTPLTHERQLLVRSSRIGAAHFLRQTLKDNKQSLKAFISASAIGYYGYTDEHLEVDENGAKGRGFSADLSADWEAAADLFKTENIANKVAKIRVPLALGNDGGLFPMLKDAMHYNKNSVRQGKGEYSPWNHVEDMARIFAFILENELEGVYNAVAPQAITMQDIFKAISNEMYNTKYKIKTYEGHRLVANKLMQAGYKFKFSDIESAVKNLL